MKLFNLLEGTERFIAGPDGKPLRLYRGMVATAKQGFIDAALRGEPRAGYATFLSNNPHVASTYANPNFHTDDHMTGVIIPVFVKATELIEFPTKTRKFSDGESYKEFDKFEFDRRAQSLAPGQVLVVRGITDTGPRASRETDPEALWSYASDVYALNKGTIIIPALSHKEDAEVPRGT